MKGSKEFTGNRLYGLVHSFTQKEKLRFRNYIGYSQKTSDSNAANYIRLFDAIQQQREWNEKAIIKEIFKGNTTAFHRSARYLGKIIIESLVHFEGGNRIAVVEKAAEKGFVNFAIKNLRIEIERSFEREDIGTLSRLYEIRETFRKTYRTEIELKTGFSSIQEAISESSDYFKAKRLYLSIREEIKTGIEDSPQDYQKEIAGLGKRHLLDKTKIAVLRVRMIYNRLIDKLEEASLLQREIVSIQSDNPSIYLKEEIINDQILSISLLITIGEFEEAQKELFIFGSREEESEELNNRITKFWMVNSLYLAAFSGNIDLGVRVVKDLKTHYNLLENKEKGFCFYAASILEMVQGNWKAVSKWCNRINRLPDDSIVEIQWVPHLLKSIAYLELEEIVSAKKNLELATEKATNYPNRYPMFVVNALNRFLKTEQANRKELAHEITLELIDSPLKESKEFAVLNIVPWLKSISSNSPIVINGKEDHFLFRIALVS